MKTRTPLVIRAVSDVLVHATPNTQQALPQFVNVRHQQLMDLLLYDVPYLVVDLFEVGTVQRKRVLRAQDVVSVAHPIPCV